MSHTVWFRTPLICPNCGTEVPGADTRLYTNQLAVDERQGWADAGDVLELYASDFDDGYVRLRDPGDATVILALEQWGCPACGTLQWAMIEFRREAPDRVTFVGARAVPLDADALRDAHFVSRELVPWLRANPGPENDRLLATVGSSLPDD